MTRHGKNSTAGSVYTYHERQKDTKESGYGSKGVRLGKDSVKEFDCCCLTLQPCKNPIVTPDGYLYDKEAILEYIIHQKRDVARKLKEYERQKTKEKREMLELEAAARESAKQKFAHDESSIRSKILDPFRRDAASSSSSASDSISNMTEDKAKKLPAFWVPTQTPAAKATLLKKPDEKVRCPMSMKPLKVKHFIDVHFTPINDRDAKKSLIVKDARYVCAVTNDVLHNSVPIGVLKTSGHVITVACWEKLIKKDMLDPINGKEMKESDFIPLQRGSSSYAASGVTLTAKKHGPALMV